MAEEVKVKQGKSTKVKETLRVIKYALCASSPSSSPSSGTSP